MTTSITAIVSTDSNAKALRAVNKYGMNLADFAALTTTSSFTGFGNGTGYAVSSWISDGVFANLAEVQAVYPIVQSGSDYVDWVLLQSAVDFMIYGSLGSSNYKTTKRKLFIPAGLFKCNHPLQLGYARVGTPPSNLGGNGYASISIEGEGLQYDPSGNGMTGTTLWFPYTDNVGIAVNKNVQTNLKGFTLQGGYTYMVSNLSLINTAGVADLANWKDPALPSANWIGGYAVNVGIGFDVHTDANSAAAYPARILPSYFGGGTSTAQMGTAGGSDFLIEDVNITQFVMGLGHPYGDQNGEFIRFHRGSVTYCPYAINSGHSQCRNVSFRDLNLFAYHTGFTNEGGSSIAANMHGTYENIHGGYGYQLLNNSQTWTNAMQFSNCYVEGIYRIGTSASGSLSFDSCYFSIYDAAGVGLAAKSHIDAPQVMFKNTAFTVRNGLIAPQIGNGPGKINLVNCNVQTWVAPTLTGNAQHATRYMNGVFSASGSGVSRQVENHEINLGGSIGGEKQSSMGVYHDKIGLTHAGLEFIDYSANSADNTIAATGAGTLLGGVYRYPVPRIGARLVTVGTMSARSGYDITFPRFSFGDLKADEGDVFFVYQSGSNSGLEYVCVVQSISGGDMVLRQLNGYFSSSASDYQTDGNTQLTVGVSYTAAYVCTRVRYNPYFVIGSTTKGSPTISNVKHALGSGNSVSTTHLTMAAGDYMIHLEPDMLATGGSAVSPLNLVTNVNTAAQTITLTNAVNITNPNYPVVFYVKVYNA